MKLTNELSYNPLERNKNEISHNPLHHVTTQDLINLGLSLEDIADSYQPSGGGVYHARGPESVGKTLLIAHLYRVLIDSGKYTPCDAVGNLSFKGKYGQGFTTLKSDDLRQFLWDMTHKPYEHKIAVIDEGDSEFPARDFTDKDQTGIALRLWHIAKLHNYVFITSHVGNSTDIIMHLATHFGLYPQKPNFETNSMKFAVANVLDMKTRVWTAYNIIQTMLIYNRRELTEDTDSENQKIRPSLLKKKKNQAQTVSEPELDLKSEMSLD